MCRGTSLMSQSQLKTVSLLTIKVSAQPLIAADVMAVIFVATSVTRQSPHTASKARHIKIKERNCADISSRARRETTTDRWETVVRMTVTRQSLNKANSVSHQNQRKTMRRPCEKTSVGTTNARQVPKTHKTNTTNGCSQQLTASQNFF